MDIQNEIILRIKDGDEQSFHRFYTLLAPKVYSFVLRIIKSSSLAEDITQDVFLSIWDMRESLSTDKNIESLIFTIARNHTINMLKRASVDVRVRKEIITAAPRTNNVTEEQIHFEETSEILRRAIALLPPQQKKIFELCKIDGLSYEEAAQKLNISSGTVNAHIVKSLKFIREYFRKGISIFVLLCQSLCG